MSAVKKQFIRVGFCLLRPSWIHGFRVIRFNPPAQKPYSAVEVYYDGNWIEVSHRENSDGCWKFIKAVEESICTS